MLSLILQFLSNHSYLTNPIPGSHHFAGCGAGENTHTKAFFYLMVEWWAAAYFTDEKAPESRGVCYWGE